MGLLLRLPGLGDGLDHDEAYTWMAFASRSFDAIRFHYPVPNNHILHSLLVRASSLAFGEGEAALRLPALTAGVLSVPAAYWLAASLAPGPLVATVAAWVLALAPAHVDASHVARGYTILTLFSALAGGALVRAHRRGGWWLWSVYAGSLFLALYTQPSAALLAVALASWSLCEAVRRRDRGLQKACLAAHGAVALLAAWAYGPIVDRVLAAGRAWGIDLHAGSFAAFSGLVAGVARDLSGTWAGALPLALALVGGWRLVRGGGQLRWLAASVVALPFLVPLLYGIAPQPRGYLFLLPWAAAAAGVGVAALGEGRAGRAVGGLALGLLAAASGYRALTHEADPRWRAPGESVSARTVRGEILVAPAIMDVEVLHYARTAVERGLVTTLMDGQLRSLLFAAQRGDPRFDLARYALAPAGGQERRELAFAPEAFDALYESGSRGIYRLARRVAAVMPQTWQWHAHPEEVDGVRFGASGPAVSERPGLAVINERGAPFRLFSDARFRPQADGLCLLAAARTDPLAEISLYRVQGGALAGGASGDGDEQVAQLQMLLTAAQPVRAVGRDGRVWFLEAFLLPIEAGRDYGVYVRGSAAARQDFADIRVFALAWP